MLSNNASYVSDHIRLKLLHMNQTKNYNKLNKTKKINKQNILAQAKKIVKSKTNKKQTKLAHAHLMKCNVLMKWLNIPHF